MIIDHIDIGATAGATWELWTSTSDGAGVVVSGVNANLTSSNSAESSAFGNENITSNSSGVLLGYTKNGDNGTSEFHVNDAVILGQNDSIMIKKQLTPAGTVSGICTVTGYYE